MKEYSYEGGALEVTEDMKRDFEEDGYIIVRKLFNDKETEKIKCTIMEHGFLDHSYKVPDAEGRAPIMALWQHPGSDVTGMVGRCEKVITTSEQLLGVGELYHFHCKMLLKEPLVGGKFEWHQDYGYWYKYCLKPDMMAVLIAVDECTQENGGLQLLKGSHKYGRVDHMFTGGQQGADMNRVDFLMKKCELIKSDLQPGDAIFFHSNVLHCSGPNNSSKRRLALNVSLCEKSNEPVIENISPQYVQIDKVPNSAILDCTNMDDYTGKNFINFADDKLVKAKQ